MLLNRDRAERVMNRLGLDALVATSPENVMYASDYECSTHWLNKGAQVYAGLTPAAAPAAFLVAPSLELEAIVESPVWIEDVYLAGFFQRGPAPVEAMAAGWDPVMVRHSAAHRGAEQAVLPAAGQHGTSILTFNNTCYGRLLQPSGDYAPLAADCYRYTLAQPGVTACLSAPATLEQLDENLVALRDPRLPPDRRKALLEHGARVYQEDTTFRRLVRAL